jgi:hypothetical protein
VKAREMLEYCLQTQKKTKKNKKKHRSFIMINRKLLSATCLDIEDLFKSELQTVMKSPEVQEIDLSEFPEEELQIANIRLKEAYLYSGTMINTILVVTDEKYQKKYEIKASYYNAQNFAESDKKFNVESTGASVLAKREEHLFGFANQVGCALKCSFCSVEPFKKDLTATEMRAQFLIIMNLMRRAGFIDISIPRLLSEKMESMKISLAREGDPFANRRFPNILDMIGAEFNGAALRISTIYPKGGVARRNASSLVDFASRYTGILRLQVSINSTDETYRDKFASPNSVPFSVISDLGAIWQEKVDKPSAMGGVINLNITAHKDTPCEPTDEFMLLFPNYRFAIRLRRLLLTEDTASNGWERLSDQDIADKKIAFEEKGYVVLDASTTPTEEKYHLATGQYNKGVSWDTPQSGPESKSTDGSL